jgi:predicted small lipoprotein YifL
MDAVMRSFRPYFIFVSLILVLALSACGNKGDLVKPTPPATPTPPAAPDTATPTPAQDPAQH